MFNPASGMVTHWCHQFITEPGHRRVFFTSRPAPLWHHLPRCLRRPPCRLRVSSEWSEGDRTCVGPVLSCLINEALITAEAPFSKCLQENITKRQKNRAGILSVWVISTPSVSPELKISLMRQQLVSKTTSPEDIRWCVPTGRLR